MAGLWSLAVVLAGLIIFAGCSKKDSPDASSQNVWRRPLFLKIQSLDAGNMSGGYAQSVAAQMYEPLYDFAYLERPFKVIPLLAEDLPEISEDHLTYTIRIRSGVLFHDDPCFPDGIGREVKASDFVYALKRIANVKYLSQKWTDWDGRIAGLDEFREYSKQFKKELDVDYSTDVEGIRALDDYTIQIKLTKPWPQILMILTNPNYVPVAREAVEYYDKEITYHPVGTGPYKLKTWRRGFYIEMIRNEKWRGQTYPSVGAPGDLEKGLLEDAGTPLPKIDRLVYRVIEEFQPAWLMFKRGELEWMQTYKDNFSEAVNVSSVGLEASEEMKARGIELVVTEEPGLFWIGFNMEDPILGNNKPLRMAISRAIDRKKDIDLFFNGVHKVAYGMIPPVLAEYDPNIVNTEYAQFDPVEARKLVKEAEKIHGGPIPKLRLANPGTSPLDRQMGQFLQKEFADVGLELEVDYMDWPTYLDTLNKGKHQIYQSGASLSIPDPMDMFASYYSKNKGYQGNHNFYSNPEFDRLYKQAEVMFPGPQRTAVCRQMERIVLDDYVSAFCMHRVLTSLRQDWFEDYKPNVYSYNNAKYWRLDLEEKSRYKDRLKELKKQKK